MTSARAVRVRRLRGVWLGAVGVIGGLIVPWSLAVALGVKPVILPPIAKVIRSGVALVESHVLGPALVVSLGRVSLGFLLAALTAVPLGVVLGRSKRLWLVFEPLVESFRFVIPFAWIPLAILWFGTHEAGKIFIIWYAGFFLILLHAIAGVRAVDPDLIKAAKTLGITVPHSLAAFADEVMD
jgi:ABC-type nitrate/sulfonate/bicarbonate transport system permease component